MRRLKHYFIFTPLLLLLSSCCLAATTSMNIPTVSKTDIDQRAYSTIKIAYPVIKNTPYSDAFNASVQSAIDSMIIDYKKNLVQNQPLKPIAGLPLTVNSNTLDVNYKVFQATPKLISLRFSIYTNFYGAAHPLTVYQSLNYDFKQGKVLSLNDIFQSSDYLNFLSDYSKKILTAKLSKAAATHTEPDAQGLRPVPENFQIWNLENKGLLLTFPPYQVAAYVFGSQEVLVPKADIQKMLRADYH